MVHWWIQGGKGLQPPLWAAQRKAKTGKKHVPCQVWASGTPPPPFNKVLDPPAWLNIPTQGEG